MYYSIYVLCPASFIQSASLPLMHTTPITTPSPSSPSRSPRVLTDGFEWFWAVVLGTWCGMTFISSRCCTNTRETVCPSIALKHSATRYRCHIRVARFCCWLSTRWSVRFSFAKCIGRSCLCR